MARDKKRSSGGAGGGGGGGGGGKRKGKAQAVGHYRPTGGAGAHDASSAPQEHSLRRAKALQTLLRRKAGAAGVPSLEELRIRLQLGVALRNGGEIERAAKELTTLVDVDASDALHAHRLAAPLLLFLGQTDAAAELLARFAHDNSAAARCCSLLAALAIALQCADDGGGAVGGAAAAAEAAAVAAFEAAFASNWRAVLLLAAPDACARLSAGAVAEHVPPQTFAPNQSKPPQRTGLAFTRYCFNSKLYCASHSSVYCPLPLAKPTLYQYYCTPLRNIHSPSTPAWYAIHDKILVMAISCKGQGRGRVAEHIGHDADALNKRNTVALMLVGALESIALQSMRELYKLANVSKGHGAYDHTRYGRTRASPTSFVTHHMQQISKAAVVHDF